jgi:hypothetical protein
MGPGPGKTLRAKNHLFSRYASKEMAHLFSPAVGTFVLLSLAPNEQNLKSNCPIETLLDMEATLDQSGHRREGARSADL